MPIKLALKIFKNKSIWGKMLFIFYFISDDVFASSERPIISERFTLSYEGFIKMLEETKVRTRFVVIEKVYKRNPKSKKQFRILTPEEQVEVVLKEYMGEKKYNLLNTFKIEERNYTFDIFEVPLPTGQVGHVFFPTYKKEYIVEIYWYTYWVGENKEFFENLRKRLEKFSVPKKELIGEELRKFLNEGCVTDV